MVVCVCQMGSQNKKHLMLETVKQNNPELDQPCGTPSKQSYIPTGRQDVHFQNYDEPGNIFIRRVPPGNHIGDMTVTLY